MEYKREIIQLNETMSVTEYLQEIGAFAYTDEQYYYIALTHVRVKQLIELRNILLTFKSLIQANTYNMDQKMNELKELSSEHTDDLNSLLDLFNVCCKSVDEHR